jgi:hypothetical protein
MEKIEVGNLTREQRGVRQTGAVVLRGVTRDRERGTHRLLERGRREVGGAGVAAPRVRALADVNRDADALVAVVLDRLDRALAHGYRQAAAFGNVALAGARAQPLCVPDDRGGELLQLRGAVGEAMAVCHGAL